MRAGKLRNRVTIQAYTATRNTYGEEVPTWTTFSEVWGAVEPLSGREFIEGQQLDAAVNSRIRIRYQAGITPAMRAIMGDRTFDIQAVIETNTNHREVVLMCQEVT